MTSPVNHSTATTQVSHTHSQQQNKVRQQQPPKTHEDTVQLSNVAEEYGSLVDQASR